MTIDLLLMVVQPTRENDRRSTTYGGAEHGTLTMVAKFVATA